MHIQKLSQSTRTPLDRSLNFYTTLWNIWTYQQLCKKLHNLCKILHNLCTILNKLCNFFTQQLVGSYVSQCCVNFLNSGLTVYIDPMVMHNAKKVF